MDKFAGFRTENKSMRANKLQNQFQRLPSELKGLSHLGSNTSFNHKVKYNPKLLEAFDNKNPKQDSWISFLCPEFTSLCPKTGQPDFARIFINYIANLKMVESKSLKLYLMSFRQDGHFHEDCIQMICNDLSTLLRPNYLEVIGEFTPRGGIAIFPFSSYANNKPLYRELKKNRLMNYSPRKFSSGSGSGRL